MAVGLNQLEICGADINNARSAEHHIKVLLQKVQLTHNNKVVYPKYFILDTREDSGRGVLYEKAETWWPNCTAHPIIPRIFRCAMTSSEPGDHGQDLQLEQHYEIQNEIQRALDIARYEKGTYELSIRLGCLAMKQPVSDASVKHDLDKFLVGITNKRELDFVIEHWYVSPHLILYLNPTKMCVGSSMTKMEKRYLRVLLLPTICLIFPRLILRRIGSQCFGGPGSSRTLTLLDPHHRTMSYKYNGWSTRMASTRSALNTRSIIASNQDALHPRRTST